jgi:hypothetical protein
MSNFKDIWIYERELWVSHYKNKSYFGKLPKEINQYILNILIKNIIELRKSANRLVILKKRIQYLFNHNIPNFHFEYEIILCTIDIVKKILENISKLEKKPINITHFCCGGRGIMFKYLHENNESNNESNNE